MDTLGRIVVAFLLSVTAAHAVATPTEAYAQMERGEYTSAVQVWQSVVAAEPEYVLALNNLAYCQMMLGDYANAAESYTKADAVSQNLDSKAGVQWALVAAGQYGDSIAWGKAALTIDPQNYWVKYRLALAHEALDNAEAAEKNYGEIMEVYGSRTVTLAPRGQVIPYYQSIQYTGSSLKSSGFDAGMFALWNFNSGTTTGAGYARNELVNPKNSGAYQTNEIRLLTGFLFNDLSSLTFNGHILASSSAFLNGGTTLSATYRAGLVSGFALTADALIFPQHGGVGFTPMYYFPLARNLQLGLGAGTQIIGFAQAMQFYGAAQAALRYCAGIFCLSAGGLYGSLFTPLLDAGNVLAYNPDTLNLQGYAKISLRPADFVEVSAGYTYARWKAISGETPTSGIFSVVVTGSLR